MQKQHYSYPQEKVLALASQRLVSIRGCLTNPGLMVD